MATTDVVPWLWVLFSVLFFVLPLPALLCSTAPPPCPSLLTTFIFLSSCLSHHPTHHQGEWGSTQKESEEEQAKRSHFARVKVTTFTSQMAVLQKSYEVCLHVLMQ